MKYCSMDFTKPGYWKRITDCFPL